MKKTFIMAEEKADQLVLKYPIATFNRLRFRFNQKTTFVPRYRHARFFSMDCVICSEVLCGGIHVYELGLDGSQHLPMDQYTTIHDLI